MRGKKVWSIIAFVFLYVIFISQIQCISQTRFLDYQQLKEQDIIENMIGQPSVSFKQYGGYVNINESAGHYIYYYFVESVKAPESSPLVLWFNGGPACSSLTGAFIEHGPFRVHSDGKTLYQNPYSWNNEANMLYVESPTQVGFSYRNTPSTEQDIIGDTITAEENYAFLVKWLERFPEYQRRELYIATESYGGHYGPQLARVILQRQKQTFINLQGVLLGNPTLDSKIIRDGTDEYYVSHALASTEIVAQKNQNCNGPGAQLTDNCYNALDKLVNLTKNLDIYNIYAPVCLNPTLTNKPKEYTTVLEFDPCSTKYFTSYLNMENVQIAMNAITTKLKYRSWLQCNDMVGNYWPMDEKSQSMLPTLHELMRSGIRTLVYSGDADSVVSVTTSMNSLKKMNLTIEKPWRPWFSQGQVAGYTEEYKGNLMFTTVKGSGHMVPSDAPMQALTLFTSFIHNTPLPHS